MRTLLMCLMASLLLLGTVYSEPPTREKFDTLVEEDPELVYMMIVKLYLLERAYPIISLPQLMVINMEDGSSNIQWDGVMAIDIGDAPNNLKYEVVLEVSNVISGYKPEREFPWGWVIIGGVGLFATGVAIGILVF